jgi:hypothetical protein
MMERLIYRLLLAITFYFAILATVLVTYLVIRLLMEGPCR